VALACKAKPALQLKHVAMVAVKQVAQFVPHGKAVVAVMTGLVHVGAAPNPDAQAVQVITFEAMVHAVQPELKPVAVVDPCTGEATPVAQLTQIFVLRTYPDLQAVQVAVVAAEQTAQLVSKHATQEVVEAIKYP
jgi:hypothetical protein